MKLDADVILTWPGDSGKCQRCRVNGAEALIRRPGEVDARKPLPICRKLCKRCVSDLVEKFFKSPP